MTAAIKNFRALDQFTDPGAILAYAKAALIKVTLLQQLIMLYAAEGGDTEVRTFAKTAADWLQASTGSAAS